MPVPALCRWPAAHLRPGPAAPDQAGRAVPPPGSRAAVLDLEPGQAGRVPGRRGVVDDHQPRGPAAPAPRGRRVLSSDQDLEAVTRPGLRGQEEPHPAPVRADRRHRRRPGRRPEGQLRGRVRAPQPPAAPGPAVDGSGGGALVPRRRRRATSTRPHGVRHLLAADDPSRDRLYGHIKPRKRRGEFLVFLRYLRTRSPPGVRLGIVLDNFSPDLSTAPTAGSPTGRRPTTSSWPMCPPTLGG
jgi:hypothetical protein